MESRVTVVGTGPGDSDYLTYIGREKIKEADVLVGGRRLLETFAQTGQKKYIIDRNIKKAADFIKDNYQREYLVVLVSGDTGIYSFASYLARELPDEALEFIPGVSSVQLMFARLKRPWQDASILSLHGRVPEGVASMVEEGETVALLTDSKFTPRRAAEYLIEKGCSNRKAAVGANLSYKNEKVNFFTLSELAASEDDPSPAVVVINYG